MDISPRLSLSYVAPNQAQKHVTVNETFRRLDALVQLSVISRTTAAEPSSPAEGDAYILPAGANGAAWDNFGQHDVAAFQDGAWTQIAPAEGFCAWVGDEDELVAFDGAAWDSITVAAIESAASFGINATADATNKLSVKSDAILFSHDDVTPGSGDAQVKVNKAAASDTASHLFQTNFSGRAEFGLTGDDDFHVKVSPDGSSWTEAVVIDKDDGHVALGPVSGGSVVTITGATGLDPANGDLHLQKEDGYVIAMLSEYSSASAFNSPFSVQRRARGSIASPAAVQSGDWLGGFSFRGYAPSGGFMQRALVNAIVDGSPSGSTVPTALLFQTGSSGLSERMRVTSAGDVGIGVSSPSTKLQVDGPVRVKSYTVAGAPSASTSGAGAVIYVSDETGGATLAFSDGANWRRTADRAVIS